MKKFLTIILVNIILIGSIFLIADYIRKYNFYSRYCKKEVEETKKLGYFANYKECMKNYKYSIKCEHISKYIKKLNLFDNVEYPDITSEPKSSILIFGCSFAEGSKISAKLLANLTDSVIYDFGIGGRGISEMFYLVNSSELYKNIDSTSTPPKYVIYIFIPDQLSRIYRSKYAYESSYINWGIENGHLVEKKSFYHILNRFDLFKSYHMDKVYSKDISVENNDKNFDLIKLFFMDSRAKLMAHYPKIKYIIIKHPQCAECLNKNYENGEYNYVYTTPRWKELEEEGFIIFDTRTDLPDDITDRKYFLPDGHPNKLAWDFIYTELVKKLKKNDVNLFKN